MRLEKRHVGFLTGMISMSFFLANASLFSRRGLPYHLFFSVLMMWLSYLFAHRSIEGKFVDGNSADSTTMPRSWKKLAGSLIGSGVLVAGMVTGVSSVRAENLEMTFLAASLFVLGYVTTHYFTTGEPV